MTKKEVVLIKSYIKGAFPNFKDDQKTDVIWYDMLKDEEYYGILQSVKNFIKSGSKYPPTLAEVLKGYDLILDSLYNDVINLMDEDGFFDDPEGTPAEITLWNKKNRKRKALFWVTGNTTKSVAPEWFKEIFKSYKDKLKTKYFSLSDNTQKKLN